MPGSDPTPLKQWTWKATVNGDPCTFYCDLTKDLVLDFYGDSHHPLWKGPFDVGKQSPADLVLDGPLPAAHMSSATRGAITQYLQRYYTGELTAEKRSVKIEAKKNAVQVASSPAAWKSTLDLVAGHSAWLNVNPTSPRLISNKELAIYERLGSLTAKDPVLYPEREPNPLMGNDAMLEIILEMPKFPAEQLTDVSLGVGDACLYERHMFDPGSPLRQSRRVLAFQGPVMAGEYDLKLFAQYNVPATKDNPSANLQRKVLIERGKLCSYAITLADKEADVSAITMPDPAEVEIHLKLGGSRHFERCAVWLGDLLLFDEAASSVTCHIQRMRPEIHLAELDEVYIFKGLLPPGLYALRIDAQVLTEGEVDARPAALTESIRLVAGNNAPLVFQLPETARHASPEQKAKAQRIQALRDEIIMIFKAGAQYSEGDKEGGWLRIFFRTGGFFSESGSYVDGSNYGESPMNEDKVVDRLLELNAVYLRDRPMEDKLINLRDSLRSR